MNKKILLFLPLLILSSCGAQINKIAPYATDHSGSWHDNYYTYFDEKLKERKTEQYHLSEGLNNVFTSFTSPSFLKMEEMAKDINNYYNDFASDGFGPTHRLGKYNESVKEGFTSKLFDGQLFCHQYYELSRVQIAESGFSCSFNKTLVSASYLYLNFKSAVDFKSYSIKNSFNVKLKLHITLYGKRNITYTYQLDEVPTNAGETYVFYGFSLAGFDLTDVTDFAISYTMVDNPAQKEVPSIEHALLLYEFGLKDPTFK